MGDRDQELLGLLPPIRRARGYRLYAQDGRRFLDLWQDDGRGLLGAKGTGLGTVAKALIDRGLSLPLPSALEARLVAEVLALYPGWEGASAFTAEAEAREAAAAVGHAGPLALVRPFATAYGTLYPEETPPGDCALARLPCPRALSPAILLRRGAATGVPLPSLPIPPLLLGTAAKALQEFRGYAAAHEEGHWRRVDRRLDRLFRREGPYLRPTCAEADYPALFRAALAAGVLLSPTFSRPSLVPGDFDDGELKGVSSL